MKRSKMIQLVLISSSLVSLVSCDQNKQEAQKFSSKAECEKVHDTATCEKMNQENLAEYAKTAPKYQSKEECEKTHGEGKCTTPPGQHQSMFMPMMMGYYMGRMMSGSGPVATPQAGNRAFKYSPSANQPSAQRGGFGRSGSAFSSSGS